MLFSKIEHGAPDFTVFYTAWHLVLEGRGAEIYRESPDRFLYAPGFAWLLSPLAWLPRSAALAIWCFAKAAVAGLTPEVLSTHYTDGLRFFHDEFVPRLKARLSDLTGGSIVRLDRT